MRLGDLGSLDGAFRFCWPCSIGLGLGLGVHYGLIEGGR